MTDLSSVSKSEKRGSNRTVTLRSRHVGLRRKLGCERTADERLIYRRNQIGLHEQLNHVTKPSRGMTSVQNVRVFMDGEKHDPRFTPRFLQLLRHFDATHQGHREFQDDQVGV